MVLYKEISHSEVMPAPVLCQWPEILTRVMAGLVRATQSLSLETRESVGGRLALAMTRSVNLRRCWSCC
jgi:hypothetical protein